MSYIDKKYYDDEYSGEDIDNEHFERFNKRAEDVVNSLTDYQISKIGFDKLEPLQQELVKKAVCAQIEYFQVEGIEANITGISSASGSVSISGFSYSGQASSSRQTSRAAPSCLMYLDDAGLLRERKVKISVI